MGLWMSGLKRELYEKIQKAVGFEFDSVVDDVIPILDIPNTQIVRVLTILQSRQDLQFLFLTDIVVVDRLGHDKRFELNYLITSLLLRIRMNIQTFLEEDEFIESITSIYKSAHWHECEIYELFGISFHNNHRMRSLFFRPGYDEFPLRKDYIVS